MFAPGSIPPSRAVSPSNADRYSRKASIVLIGMRGGMLFFLPFDNALGKTTLATLAAKALGWELLDTDTVFEQRYRSSIVDFVSSHGWDEFRRVESEILHELLGNHATGKVIACGGGVVELDTNRTLLKQFRSHGLVIHVLRDKDAVLKYIRESTHFPPYYHESAKEAWDRR
ncbi:shikimate kinase-domain-containing protein, partial [Mycena crocata]